MNERDRLERLARLRDGFLRAGDASRGLRDYWRDTEDLEVYDEFLGERIGQKWDAVLEELVQRSYPAVPTDLVVDLGCGSGIAGRRYAACFPLRRLEFHDRSTLAMDFAAARARRAFPSLEIVTARDPKPRAVDVLLVSHVLDELDAVGEAWLSAWLEVSRTVIFVEPGTHAVSRRLGAFRERLRSQVRILGPCPHAAACPALNNESDWCHFFAKPAPESFTDGDTVRRARELGVDLRSLPYAFLAWTRRDTITPDDAIWPGRVLGRPRVATHAAELSVCGLDGLTTARVEKRRDRALYKQLDKRPHDLRRWPPPAEAP
ncbi:MAG: small ribosomal subunit Rsm22 family protein [Planctomycetota bacterium]